MNIRDRLSIKEKRTFIARLKCSCGKGEYRYSAEEIVSDLFGTFFNAMNNGQYKFAHKCTACGDTKHFQQQYPLSLDFDIGLDCSQDQITSYCAETFKDKMTPDLEYLGYLVTDENIEEKQD